jgi:predicted nucleic acid-binding protein
MVLVDTSAWVEFLRDTRSPVCRRVNRLLGGDVATTDPVRMEVVAGARDEVHATELQRLLLLASAIAVTSGDCDDAAALYRACRRGGETPRRLIDCLIAAVAIRAGVPVLHADADFDVLARHTPLRVA